MRLFMTKTFRFILLSSLVVVGYSFAAEPTAPAKPWKNSTEVSVVSANGNTKTNTTSAKEDFIYEWTRIKLNLFGSALGAKSQNEITAEEYSAGEKVDFKMTDKDYLYEKFQWDSKRFTGIRHRYDAGAGYGRKIVDSAKNKLNAEIGGGYINEQRIDAPRNDFGSGRVYSKYIHQFTDTSSFSQDGEYLHNFRDSDGYRINTETALTAGLTTHLSLKTSFIWNRVGKPVPGTIRDDTKLAAALLITY